MKQFFLAPSAFVLPLTILVFGLPALYLLVRSAYEDFRMNWSMKRIRINYASA